MRILVLIFAALLATPAAAQETSPAPEPRGGDFTLTVADLLAGAVVDAEELCGAGGDLRFTNNQPNGFWTFYIEFPDGSRCSLYAVKYGPTPLELRARIAELEVDLDVKDAMISAATDAIPGLRAAVESLAAALPSAQLPE